MEFTDETGRIYPYEELKKAGEAPNIGNNTEQDNTANNNMEADKPIPSAGDQVNGAKNSLKTNPNDSMKCNSDNVQFVDPSNNTSNNIASEVKEQPPVLSSIKEVASDSSKHDESTSCDNIAAPLVLDSNNPQNSSNITNEDVSEEPTGVDEITDKCENLNLEDSTTIADDQSFEVIDQNMIEDEAIDQNEQESEVNMGNINEDVVPSLDENCTTCDSTVSGDIDAREEVGYSDESTMATPPDADSMNNDQQQQQQEEQSIPTDEAIAIKNVIETNDLTNDQPIKEDKSTKVSKYSRETLLELRRQASKNVMENLGNSDQAFMKDIARKELSSDASNSLLPRYYQNNAQMNRMDTQYRNKSMVQPYRRTNQQGKNYIDAKGRKIASTSLNSASQLQGDAWRPGKITATDPEEIKTLDLLLNARAILNKLTPENYQTLLTQFRELNIDSKDRLSRIIDLIFEKSVREPAFVVQYAGFCSELLNIKVTEKNAEDENVEVDFRVLLLNKCQETFHTRLYQDNENIPELESKIQECDDPVKRKELEEMLDDEKRSSRKRSVGNIKLIAELYKLRLLSSAIMATCFEYLLANFFNQQHEEYIECLCALITNIGDTFTKNLQRRPEAEKTKELKKTFEKVFAKLKEIHSEDCPIKVSSRTRFMILDLIDLKKNNWVPRRKAEGPKLLAQVHEDMEMQQKAKTESINNELKKKKANSQQDDWQLAGKNQQRRILMYPNKPDFAFLKNISAESTKPASSSNAFAMFKSGSHGGSTPQSQSRSSSTNYENKNQSSNDKSQRAYHDSLNAKTGRRDERKISDATNYQRSDSSQSLKKSDSFDNDKASELDAQLQDNVTKWVSDYLSSEDFDETLKEIKSNCSKQSYAEFITLSILSSIEKTSQRYNPRERWGEFLGKFFTSPIIEYNDIFEGLKKVFLLYEDYKLDIPKYFEYIGEVIGHALLQIVDDSAQRKEIVKTIVKSYNEISGNECTLFKDSLFQAIGKTNPNLLEKIKPCFPTNSKGEKFDKLKSIINDYLKSLDFDDVVMQIEKNYPDNCTSDQFKTELYYSFLVACLKSSNGPSDNVANNLDKINNVIKYFVKTKEDQFLFLKECSNLHGNLNNPNSLLGDIFQYLHEKKLINDDSFLKWANDSRVGIALANANVKRFIDSLSQKKD